jgi:transcription elongation factor GreA
MRVPIRKSDKYSDIPIDPFITPAKAKELEKKLDRLKTVSRPRESAEVQRLALMGDFSENVGYQLAKGRLRGINQRILDIENQLKLSSIIAPVGKGEVVELGRTVTIKRQGREKAYLILGSLETDPTAGIISYQSPLGSALLGHQVGDNISWPVGDKEASGEIIKIE